MKTGNYGLNINGWKLFNHLTNYHLIKNIQHFNLTTLFISGLLILLSCGLPPKEKAMTILKNGLKDESVIIRVNAAKGLMEISESRGIEVLYEVLKGTNKEAIVAALGALYDLKEKTCSPIIIQLSNHEDPLIRTEAYKLTAIIKDKSCREVLIKGTTDKIAKIRRISYSGLEKFKEKIIIHSGLRDIDPLVRIASAKALGKMGGKGMENFIRKELTPQNPNPEIWAQGYLALAEMSDTSALPYIKDLLTDTPWDLRITAAEALLILNNQDGLDVLKQGLKSNDPFVRVKSVEVVSRFPILEFYDLLKEATHDQYINVSIGAIDALKGYHKRDCQKLFEKLMDAPNPLLRIAAATAYLKYE